MHKLLGYFTIHFIQILKIYLRTFSLAYKFFRLSQPAFNAYSTEQNQKLCIVTLCMLSSENIRGFVVHVHDCNVHRGRIDFRVHLKTSRDISKESYAGKRKSSSEAHLIIRLETSYIVTNISHKKLILKKLK